MVEKTDNVLESIVHWFPTRRVAGNDESIIYHVHSLLYKSIDQERQKFEEFMENLIMYQTLSEQKNDEKNDNYPKIWKKYKY